MRLFAAMLGIVVLAGCADTEFSRANTSADEMRRDEAACRRAVGTQMQRDRNIESDIGTTVGTQGQQVRPNDSQTRQQIASRGDTVRSERLMENCMRSRGYAGAKDPKPATPPAAKP
jgi:hypothetical protein